MELVIVFGGMAIICAGVAIGALVMNKENSIIVAGDAAWSGAIFATLALVGLFFV